MKHPLPAFHLARLLWPVIVMGLLACSSEPQSSCTGDCEDAATSSDGAVLDSTTDTTLADTTAATSCPAQPSWQGKTSIFEELSVSKLGLAGVQGTILSVVDYNADGWPDLMVRKGGADNFAENERSNWLLRNDGKGNFVDVTEESGLFKPRLSSKPGQGRPARVVVFADVDNDGDVDAFLGQPRTDISETNAHTSELAINQGDGTFDLGPAQSAARFEQVISSPAGATFVDVNLDGKLDLWVVHNERPGLVPVQDRLLLGDGKGAFTDITNSAGLTTSPWQSTAAMNNAQAHSWGWSSTACDLNEDGRPELLAASYGRAPNHLWVSQTAQNGASVSYANQSIASEYAFDNRQDWRDNLNAQCYCRDNPSAAECDTCPKPQSDQVCASLAQAFGPNYRWNHSYGRQPFQLGGVTATTICADVNQDGHLDLVNFEIVHGDVGTSSDPTEVLLNDGPDGLLHFSRLGPEVTGLARPHDTPFWDHGDMTGAVFDADNDGRADIYVGGAEYAGTRAHLFRQQGPLKWQELPTSLFFDHKRAQGVAIADFDRDGDLDVVVGHSRHRCEGAAAAECQKDEQVRYFRNVVGNKQRWIQVQLHGSAMSNKMAIGARVTVRTADGAVQAQVVDGGHGRFGFQRSHTLHFGLGSHCDAEVTVHWPDKQATSETHVLEAKHRWRWIQGQQPTKA
ncbi:MAG TPA: hypothetical protein DCQ06_14390, partial [Myxococcales bacterium]|nr:hypothetical protein [Myxococcales bacterium]